VVSEDHRSVVMSKVKFSDIMQKALASVVKEHKCRLFCSLFKARITSTSKSQIQSLSVYLIADKQQVQKSLHLFMET
jgi:hypothetical protein